MNQEQGREPVQQSRNSKESCSALVTHGQALTGTRYPTLPGIYFYYPYPTRKSFENFRVQGSNIHAGSIQDYINDASYFKLRREGIL